MEGVVANPYAIVIHGYEANQYYTPVIHNNIINQTNARGIDLDAIDWFLGMKGGLIYNNYIDTKQGCLIDNYGGDKHPPSCGTHSLRIRGSDNYYFAGKNLSNSYGENSNNWIYNNTIIMRQGELLSDGSLSGFGYALRFRVLDYNQSLNLTFENNTFISITNSTFDGQPENDLQAASVYTDGILPGNNIIFRNNKFVSNFRPLWVAGSDIKFIDNTIERFGVVNSYYTSIMVGYWIFQSTGNLFLNQSFVNSPGFSSLVYRDTDGGNIKNITVKWYLDVNVASGGVPVSGASVEVRDLFNSLVFSGTTDASGFIKTNLIQYTEICNMQGCTPSKTNYTPHSLYVEKQGYKSETNSLIINSSKTLNIQLQSSSSEVNAF